MTKIFLDCDGVLADFDAHAIEYFGMHPREFESRFGAGTFWMAIKKKGDFFRSLPIMPDAHELVQGVAHLDPVILTGCPSGGWAEEQKLKWAEEHFPELSMITCRSADKRDHAEPGDVLIDDWPKHRHKWIEMGGIFISHYDAQSSLDTLWAHYPDLKGQ